MTDFLGRVLRGLFKLLLVAAALVFVTSFLLAALVIVAGVSLWSLLTGRKPAPVVMFGRMREQSRRYTSGVWPGAKPVDESNVVDVTAHEVVDSEVRTEPLRPLR